MAHDYQFLILKQSFLHTLAIFKSFVIFRILSIDFLIHKQIVVDSHKKYEIGESGKAG